MTNDVCTCIHRYDVPGRTIIWKGKQRIVCISVFYLLLLIPCFITVRVTLCKINVLLNAVLLLRGNWKKCSVSMQIAHKHERLWNRTSDFLLVLLKFLSDRECYLYRGMDTLLNLEQDTPRKSVKSVLSIFVVPRELYKSFTQRSMYYLKKYQMVFIAEMEIAVTKLIACGSCSWVLRSTVSNCSINTDIIYWPEDWSLNRFMT